MMKRTERSRSGDYTKMSDDRYIPARIGKSNPAESGRSMYGALRDYLTQVRAYQSKTQNLSIDIFHSEIYTVADIQETPFFDGERESHASVRLMLGFTNLFIPQLN
jgi:hypothetical protein